MRILILCSSLIFLVACHRPQSVVATDPSVAKPSSTLIDPFESYNRPVYGFNKTADRVILKPVARVYQAILPRPLQGMVRNFFQNLGEIPSAVNDSLQGNWSGLRTDLGRLVLNSTWGMGGFFDLAAKRGTLARKQDFGLTLAKWGYRQSPYLVLPFLGPSTVRDGVGRLGTYYMGVQPYLQDVRLRNSLFILNFVEVRASLLSAESALKEAIDEYIFVRNAYLQRRQSEMDGQSSPPLEGPPE